MQTFKNVTFFNMSTLQRSVSRIVGPYVKELLPSDLGCLAKAGGWPRLEPSQWRILVSSIKELLASALGKPRLEGI